MFLYFIQTGKMTIPGDSDKLCTKNVKPRASTKNVIKKIYSNSTDKSMWNSKKCSSNPQEDKKKETETNHRRKTNTRKTMAGLSSNVPKIILNVNGLNRPIKGDDRNGLKKHDSVTCSE